MCNTHRIYRKLNLICEGEYVYKIVDRAEIAEQKFKPNRAVLVILSTLLGGILAVTIVLVRERLDL